MSENEAKTQITRWVSLAATICALAMFAAMGYSCQIYNQSWAEVAKTCVASGGTWITAANNVCAGRTP